MSKRSARAESEDISSDSDEGTNALQVQAVPRGGNKMGRPVGTKQEPYTLAECIAAFQLLLKERPVNVSGIAFLTTLKEALPTRSIQALQKFVSGKMRRMVPSLFASIYKNNWAKLDKSQRAFLREYMKDHPAVLARQRPQLAINFGPSQSRGATGSGSMFAGLKAMHSTPKRTHPLRTGQDWSLSPINAGGTTLADFTTELAEQIMKKMQNMRPVPVVTDIDGDEQFTDLDERDLSLIATMESLSDDQRNRADSPNEEEPKGDVKDTPIHSPPNDSDEEGPESCELRARISTVTLVELFPKGYKGRDSPFKVNRKDGELTISHFSQDQSGCSTEGVVDFGASASDSPAIESVARNDLFSTIVHDEALSPMKIRIDHKEPSQFQVMKMEVNSEKIPVLLKTKGGVLFDKN